MSQASQILQFAEEHLNEFLDTLKTAVEIESPTYGAKESVDRCSRFFQDLFSGLGMSIEEIAQEEVGNQFIARFNPGAGNPVMLLCHFDTVFPIGTIKEMPFTVKDNLVRGPGAYDMKGGLVAAYYALKALKKFDLLPDREIIVFGNSDEEPGSYTSKDIFMELARHCEAVVVLEPGLETVGSVKTVRKGRSMYDLHAYGLSKHAGHAPDKGINALTELSYQIMRIHEMNDYPNGISVTPIFMNGGDAGACSVPDHAVVTIDARYPNREDAVELDRKMHALTPFLQGARIEVKGGVLKQPLEFNERNRAKFAEADALAKELGFSLEERTVGGGSDGNFCGETDTPILDGYGMVGGGIHTRDEHVFLDTIPRRTALVAQLVRFI